MSQAELKAYLESHETTIDMRPGLELEDFLSKLERDIQESRKKRNKRGDANFDNHNVSQSSDCSLDLISSSTTADLSHYRPNNSRPSKTEGKLKVCAIQPVSLLDERDICLLDDYEVMGEHGPQKIQEGTCHELFVICE